VPFLVPSEIDQASRHLMEVCDYITIDVSGPEQLGMQDMYEGN
jgi:ribosomal protein S10